MLATRNSFPVKRRSTGLAENPVNVTGEMPIAVRVRFPRARPLNAILRPISTTGSNVELLTPEEGISRSGLCVHTTEKHPYFSAGRLDYTRLNPFQMV